MGQKFEIQKETIACQLYPLLSLSVLFPACA